LLAGTFLPNFCFFQNVSCPSLDIGARSEQGFFRVIDQESAFSEFHSAHVTIPRFNLRAYISQANMTSTLIPNACITKIKRSVVSSR
jgi:hypothetical protein